MKSIGEIKERFQAASAEELPELIEEYREDERGGVKKLLESAEKKLLPKQEPCPYTRYRPIFGIFRIRKVSRPDTASSRTDTKITNSAVGSTMPLRLST